MRKKKTRRQKNDELKRRYDAVKNLMSTFAMSTVAVVATVTLIPASPKAEIIKTVALSEEIVYQVNVTDKDNALDESTLFVVLENQSEHYEQQINLGESSGFFDNLKNDTKYRLSVYGSKGFGQERLDTEFITTRAKVGGTILSVTPETFEFNSIYSVDISIYDPDQKYTAIDLYYGYSWEPEQELTYTSVPITLSRQTIELTDIYTPYPIHIYIEGTTNDGVERLDEIWVTPPFLFFSEIYMAYYNNNEVTFHTYGSSEVEDLSYKMNVYSGTFLLRTETFIPSEDLHSNNKWIFDGLKPNKTYRFECSAIYTNPQTLKVEEQIIYNEEITTLNNYSFTYNTVVVDDVIEITVSINDPDDIFQIAFYEITDTTGEFPSWINGESVPLEQSDGVKSIIFRINKPNIESYVIYVGIASSTDTFRRQEIIEIDESWEE